MKSPAHFLAAASLVLSFNAAHAGDWTEFRGPGRMGHSDAAAVPVEWSDSKNVAWKAEVPGKGWSSPVIVGSRVFLTTAVEDGGELSLRTLALEASSGEPVWETEIFNVPSRKIHKKNSHASPTPIYEDGKLYVHFGPDGTACVDAKNGKVLWEQTSLTFPPVHGNGGSPIIIGDLLIFSCDGARDPYVAALDKNKGKVKWKTPRAVETKRPFSFSTPLAIEVGGKTQVVIPGSGAVMGYDPESGREIWRFLYGEGYSVVPRPVFAHGLVYVCNGFSGNTLFAIRPDGEGDVTDTHLAWSTAKGIPKESSCIVVGDLLYINDNSGVLSCFDAKTGDEVYKERLARGDYSASPVLAGGKLYFQSGEGVATVVEPGRRFKKLAENSLGEYGLSSYGVADGALFIRTESSLYRIGS